MNKAMQILNRDLAKVQTTSEILDDFKLEEQLKRLPKEYLKCIRQSIKVSTGYEKFDISKHKNKEFTEFVKSNVKLMNYVSRRTYACIKAWQTRTPITEADMIKWVSMLNWIGHTCFCAPFFLNDPEELAEGVVREKPKDSCLYLLWANSEPLNTAEIFDKTGYISIQTVKEELGILRDLGLAELTEDKKWKLSLYGQTSLEKAR